MRIAVTGCCGHVGKHVVLGGLKDGHEIIGIDTSNLPKELLEVRDMNFSFHQADLTSYPIVLDVLKGCDAVIHLAAYPNPGDYVVTVHNSNVVLSWNVLRAAAELSIFRVAIASSVNVITLVYSQGPKLHYLPLDEEHPCEPDEPYGLSKVICELQADSIVRRYPNMRIASLRLHWAVPTRAFATRDDPSRRAPDLWGYVQEDSAAEAFILAVTVLTSPARSADSVEGGPTPQANANAEQGAGAGAGFTGHERFFIAAPRLAFPDTLTASQLAARFYKDVPVKEGKDLDRVGLVNCAKAERMLGWRHKDIPEEL